jgi:hypothetical protein
MRAIGRATIKTVGPGYSDPWEVGVPKREPVRFHLMVSAAKGNCRFC